MAESDGVGRLVAGRYRLDERIGAGGMGVVWRAHDVVLHRTVAIKQLLLGPGLSSSDAEDSRARAMREGRIAARLNHPHAINVFDVALGPDVEGGEDSQPWLVMEYLPSRSLADILAERGPIPAQEAARIGRQVADALAAAHRAGIVHRDVKPGNVLIGVNGTVKITDFGIARASWDATVTRTGVLTGTPAYFAPEVARGEAPDPASDVFSLGSTLYTAVEGVPPFGNDDNTLALLRSIADGEVRAPQQSGPLSDLLMQLLRFDPEQRPLMSVTRDLLGRIVKTANLTPTTSTLPAVESVARPVALATAVPSQPPPPAAIDLPVAPAVVPPPSEVAVEDSAVVPPPSEVAAEEWAAASPLSTSEPDSVARPAAPSDVSGDVPQEPSFVPELPPSSMEMSPPPAIRIRDSAPAPALSRGERRPWWQRGRVLAALLVPLLVAIVAVVLAITLGEPDSGSTAAPATSSASAPATTTPAPTTDPNVSTAETTTPPPPAAPGPAEFVAAVQAYYGLLPNQLDEAYSYLGPNVQDQAGGRGGYENFWSQFSEVEADNVQADGTTVTLTIVYTNSGGGTFTEPYVLEMGTAEDGRILILTSEIGGPG